MTLSLSRGLVNISELMPGFLYAEYQGMATESMVPPITAWLERRIAEGRRVAIAVDATNLSSYETGYRKGWSQWLSVHRRDTEAVMILFRSNLVRMGISVVNMVIGTLIEPYSDRQLFERAVEDMRERLQPRSSATSV